MSNWYEDDWYGDEAHPRHIVELERRRRTGGGEVSGDVITHAQQARQAIQDGKLGLACQILDLIIGGHTHSALEFQINRANNAELELESARYLMLQAAEAAECCDDCFRTWVWCAIDAAREGEK